MSADHPGGGTRSPTLSERRGRVAGLLLAAGSSSRLGANKLLIELGGEAMVHRAARHAVEAGLSPVLVVVGFEADRVAAALEALPVDVIVNPRHAQGMRTSLEAGLDRIPSDCPGAAILLADMPLVTSTMLRDLVARFRSGSEPLVVSRYGDTLAPPTVYGRALFPALAAGGGKSVVRRHRAEAAELRWHSELLADLDRPEDLARLRALVPGPAP